MITRLTQEQENLLSVYRDKWIKIGLDTSPCDRKKAEELICALYAKTNQKPISSIVWMDSAFSGVLVAMLIRKTLEILKHNNTIPAVRSAVGSAVYSAVYSAVDSAVYSAVRSAVGSAVDSAVDSAVGSAVGSAVDSAVYSAVGSAVDSAVYSAVGSAVYSAVYSAVDSAVYSAVRSAVGSAVDSAVDSAVGSAVYSAVYSAVDSAVGSAVGSAVDSAVYSAVYSAVGSAVDSAVYSAVGSAVGSAVDSAVYSAVRSAVGSAGRSFFGGSLWAAWPSFIDYMSSVLDVKNIECGDIYAELHQNIGYWWALDGIVVATEHPSAINLDDGGLLHSETGMAIEYRDGLGLYRIHGVEVPGWVVTNPEKITAEKIASEENIEVRRIMIERMGHGQYLQETGAQIVDMDSIPIGGGIDGAIIRALLKDKNGLQFLCGSDGSTNRVYYMSVDPRSKSCGQAHESICGFKDSLIIANA